MTSTFLRRTSNIYHAQKRNAGEAGIELTDSLEQLRELIQQALGEPCPHCGETLKPSNVSVDHGNPTSRNGAHALGNLLVIGVLSLVDVGSCRIVRLAIRRQHAAYNSLVPHG